MIRVLVAASVLGSVAAGAVAYRRAEPSQPTASGSLDPAIVPLDGPGVLVFTSPWCVACQQAGSRIAHALDVSEEELRAGQARLAFAEADVREHPALVEALGVTRTPTIAGIDAADELRFAIEGTPSLEELGENLPTLRGGAQA